MKKILLFLGLILLAYFLVVKTDLFGKSDPMGSAAISSFGELVVTATPSTCPAVVVWESDSYVYNTQVQVSGFAIGMLYLEGIVDEIASYSGEARNILNEQLTGVNLNENGESSSWTFNGVKGTIYQFPDISCNMTWVSQNSNGVLNSSVDALTHLGFFR